MEQVRPTPYGTLSLALSIRDELNVEKEKLSEELNRNVSVNDLLREMLTLWRQHRNDPRPLPPRKGFSPSQLTPQEVKRLKELIAQNE